MRARALLAADEGGPRAVFGEDFLLEVDGEGAVVEGRLLRAFDG